MYNLVPPSALSPWLSNVTVTLQSLSVLQDHLFYGVFTSEQALYAVSVTSGDAESWAENPEADSGVEGEV